MAPPLPHDPAQDLFEPLHSPRASGITAPEETILPNIPWLISLITRFHRFVYQRSDGRLGSRILRMRFLLLFHVGRRSGHERVTPLLCVVGNGRWIVVASNAGADRHPAWWLNLQDRPEAIVQFGRARRAVKARAASDAEYEAMWEMLRASYPYYDRYRERTTRTIPVVILEGTS